MKTVQTVLGPVATDQLGSVLMHEHICTSSMGVATHYPQLYAADYEQRILRDLETMRDNGITDRGGMPLQSAWAVTYGSWSVSADRPAFTSSPPPAGGAVSRPM